MNREDIDLERGDEGIVFVRFGDVIDTSEFLEEEDEPREELKDRMSKQGLEWEDARIAAIFRDEFSLHLGKNPELTLEGRDLLEVGER